MDVEDLVLAGSRQKWVWSINILVGQVLGKPYTSELAGAVWPAVCHFIDATSITMCLWVSIITF